uniref:Uncharacterized protein n=1 Tax=Lygus hesperus TaxID=30085 RepID=A0A146M6Q1_LYGHE
MFAVFVVVHAPEDSALPARFLNSPLVPERLREFFPDCGFEPSVPGELNPTSFPLSCSIECRTCFCPRFPAPDVPLLCLGELTPPLVRMLCGVVFAIPYLREEFLERRFPCVPPAPYGVVVVLFVVVVEFVLGGDIAAVDGVAIDVVPTVEVISFASTLVDDVVGPN